MNLQTNNQITLDLSIPHMQSIRCVQGDKDSRNIQITVTNNRQPYPLNSKIHKVKYKIRKPDGQGIYNEAIINSDGTISICLNDQATAVPGNAEAELQLMDALPSLTQKILSTMKFHILIEPSVLDNVDIESQFESDVLDKMQFHMADKNNPHAVTKAQVGLENADNTADKDKNVLSAIKLTEKQKINNTEFDGTSSITTDIWGKSRKLSLSGDAEGNTDIDGSSDITIDVTVMATYDSDGNIIKDTYEAKDYFIKKDFRVWGNLLPGESVATFSLIPHIISTQKYAYMFIKKKDEMEIVASQFVPIHLLNAKSNIVNSMSLRYIIPYASYGQTSRVVATTLVMKLLFKGDNEVMISFSEEQYLGSPSFIGDYTCYFCTI